MVRRTFLRLLATSVSAFALSGRDAFGQATDRGIGGTGTPGAAEQENPDRGIGGTGVIGTVRKFGSIVVNGLRITYAKNIPVRIDGREASTSQLRIGQVVRVIANQRGGIYSTHAIDVVSEVVGDVDGVSGNHLVVLGQTVSTANLSRSHHWAAGDHIAVSGLRRPDGVIVASLIEPRSDTPDQVAGPIVQASDGSLRIGDLKLMGVDAAMIGQRALLTGKLVDGAFAVAESHSELGVLRSQVSRLLVESYIEYNEGGLYAGSGFAIAGLSSTQRSPRKAVRAVISATFKDDGTLHLNSLRIEPSGNDRDDDIPEHPANPHDRGDQSEPGGAGSRDGMPRAPDRAGGMGGPGVPNLPPEFPGPPGGPGSFGPGGPGGGGGGGGRR
ncbi:hypothetical protein CWB41_07175 [Methylovirgula ligni]|nr:hypothetical protein CWB41_07175 [Methylovirgula ligni]